MMGHLEVKFTRPALGVIALGLCLPPAALAQSPESGSLPEQAAAPAPMSDATDIIVTAQRRSERARDVPISLTVANAESLARSGVENVRDIQLITPGVRIDRFGPSTQPAVRGISTGDSSPGNDPNVALYVDGVYQPVQTANAFEFPDVERIEIAKGPQGTLFGRNATGGAIQVITREPSYEFGGKITASYGNFDTKLIKGYVSIPIVDDKLALGFTGSYEKSDGYLTNIAPGERDYGRLRSALVRGKILFEPTERLKFLLTGAYRRRNDDTGVSAAPLNGNTIGRTVPGTIVPSKPYEVALGAAFQIDESKSGNLKVDADLDFANLRSITAYERTSLRSATESAGTSGRFAVNANDVDFKTFSQEVTLTSAGTGSFNWVLGAFYYDSNAGHNPSISSSRGVNTQRVFSFQDTKAYAGFGEATLAITDKLTAIAGLRYSSETRTLTGHRDLAVGGQFPTTLPNVRIAKRSFDSFTPRFSLRYAVTPDTNAYFTYSQGFKSGGFSTLSLSPVGFDPETVKAYEIGIKSAPDRSFSINAAGFYYDYKDLQVQSAVVGSTGALVILTNNAATSEIYGIEADAVLRPSSELTFNIAASWLHARYKDFPNAVSLTPRTVGGVVCLCGNVSTTIDASGNPLIRAPDYSVSIGSTYRREFEAGTLELSGLFYYSDRFNFRPDDRIFQPSYTTINAKASFTPAGTNLTIGLWGKNLADKVIYAGSIISANADMVIYAPPRTYGVQIDFKF